MINTNLTRKAMKMAYDAHHGQLDRAGVPYIFHPVYVAEQMEDEYTCCVALLHDVVEDTEITLEQLAEHFPKEIVEAVELLTRDESMDYMEYVKPIKFNEIARKVKLADLAHNSDESRLHCVTEKDVERKTRYAKAIKYLKN